MKKICIFSRTSTTSQDVEQQTKALINEANRLGYSKSQQVIIEYQESGIKLNADTRQGIKAMKEAIENDKDIDCMICWELTRIARRADVIYNIRDFLVEHKVRWLVCKPYMELIDIEGKVTQVSSLMLGIFSSFAESEMMVKRERFDRAKNKMRIEGKILTGAVLFGYNRNNDGYAEIDEDKANIVREIFRRYENGESCGIIADDMLIRNIWTTRRRNSIIVNVNAILNDDRYAGSKVYPSIISREQFERCRQICSTHRQFCNKRSKTKQIYMLNGIICTKSGFAMCGSQSNGRYVKPDPTEGRISINLELIDEIAIDVIKDVVMKHNVIDSEKERHELNKERELNEIRIKGIDRRIEEIKEENDRIEMRIIKGRLNEDKGDMMIDNNMKEIYKLADEKENLRYAIGLIDNRIIYLSNPLVDVDNIDLSSLISRREAAQKYLKKVIIDNIGYGKYIVEIETRIGKSYKFNVISYDKKRRSITRIA